MLPGLVGGAGSLWWRPCERELLPLLVTLPAGLWGAVAEAVGGQLETVPRTPEPTPVSLTAATARFSAGGVQNSEPMPNVACGEIHISSKGTRPRDSTSPGVDWLRPIAAMQTKQGTHQIETSLGARMAQLI